MHWKMMPTYKLLLLLLLGPCFNLRSASAQVQCVRGCICFTAGTFCIRPNQDLSGMNIPEIIPGSFSFGGFVRDLRLSNTNLRVLHNDSFRGLINVTNLDLSNNQIIDLPDGLFSPMTNLVSLDLGGNSLSSLNPEAFRGLESLQTLNLQRNSFSTFPAADLLPLLPSLTTIQLSGNPFNCDDSRTAELYSTLTLSSLNVVDRIFVQCSNGTRVSDLQFNLITPTTATTTIITIVMTTIAETATTRGALFTSQTPAVTSRITATTSPTTSSAPQFCAEETIITRVGYLVWPNFNLGGKAMVPCPNGPEGSVAERSCLMTGMWSSFIENGGCSEGSETEQLLADISSGAVTESNSDEISSRLASSLPSDSTLSLQELNTVTQLVGHLVAAGSTNVFVLNNTLQVLDNVLESSTSVLSQDGGAALSMRIRAIIDTVLLDALNINQTQLVLSFSHLAVGGVYLPATNSTHLIASIRILTNGGVVINVGVGVGSGDITVDVNGNSTVQVTAYDGDGLFRESQCTNLTDTMATSNETVRGEVVTPVISVINEDTMPDDEVVTLTYSPRPYGLTEGDEYICARWNTSVNCGGGGWTTKDCMLITTLAGVFQCKCLHQGTFAILDIPPEPTTVLPTTHNLPLISRIIFYILSVASIPLYLTIIIVIFVTRELRSLPLMQCLINLSLSQGLTFLILVISFERDEVIGLCYAFGLLLQYLYLTSLSWLVAHPVVVCIRMFKRLLYEKEWLIAPFIAICWMWPTVPVAVYGGLRYRSFMLNNATFNCWLESALFPNVITYVSASTALIVIMVVTVCLLLLCFSDYTVESYTYLRLISNLPNLFLFLGVILAQYFTAAASSFHINPDYLLPVIGGFAAICGSYFFLSNAMFRSKIRNAIFCQEDPVTRSKTARYSTDYPSPHRTTPEESTGSSQSSLQPHTHNNLNQKHHRLTNTDINHLDYVSDYLGEGEENHGRQMRLVMNPVPLSLFGQVHRQPGRVRRSCEVGGTSNPAYRLDLSSEV